MNKNEKRGKKGIFKKLLTYVGLPLALFHAGTQLNYWRNDLAHTLAPSEQRAAFQREFGYPLRGWKADIEEKPEAVSRLSDVLHREYLEKPFTLTSVRIRSGSYLKKSFLGQLEDIVNGGRTNMSMYLFNRVVLDPAARSNTFHHEVKHAKTFDLRAEHPEFLEQWKALALDERGNSLYFNLAEQACSYLRLLHGLVSDDKMNSPHNERLGFITNYARTNVFEDIAELCGAAEEFPSNSHKFFSWLGHGERCNPLVQKKIQLAQTYGILPPEFSAFVALEKLHRDSWGDSHGGFEGSIGDRKKAEEFLALSEDFLRKHPHSIYTDSVRDTRAWTYYHTSFWGNEQEHKENFDRCVRESHQVFLTPYKHFESYATSLSRLERWNTSHPYGDREKAAIYGKAEDEYWRRFRSGSVSLAREGVNDYLTSQGITLP